ncbi:GGDEF domain-containing protein [Lichenibacterium dinghuense]|uniref:GGDEF domain-containing protein n=1 Tax=Lichenibacterium dinghuense TaxID=2895977 RepID=UPI001F3EDCC3|nr:diguanylate cyclase [Lichenibacterium sp. 6Y81]
MSDARPIPPTADALTERARRFAVDLMEHLVVPTFVLDTQHRVMIWNRACERLTGLAAAEVVGTSDHWMAFYAEKRPCLADLVAASRFDQIGDFYHDVSKVGMSDHGVAVETWVDLRGAGRRAYLAIDAGPIYDDAGTLVAVVETLRDITMQRQAQDALAALAARDGLTGLANRRSFDQSLDIEAKRSARAGTPLALLMVDVDGFKLFNDTYGHGGGDDCLRRVALAIAGTVRRAGDVAARYGGEEFAVILPGTGAEGGAAIAERIRAAVAGLQIPHRAAPVGTSVTVSVGGAAGAGCPGPDLLAAADAALYRAKRGGRDRAVMGEVPGFVGPARRPSALRDCA